MKTPINIIIFSISLGILVFISCAKILNKETVIKEIYETEKSFAKLCVEKGIQDAFYFFADDSAVIKRQNDTLIFSKENIKNFYAKDFYKKATVSWSPDFIEVSDDGTLAYTYGKYVWVVKDEQGKDVEYHGVFHTVWKKQKDNSWKYVWD